MTAPTETPTTEETTPTEITLKNPVSEYHPAFIFGNATKCDRVAEKDSALGQTLVICGAGPSLRESAAKFCPRGDQVWGCNSAAPWLYDNGYKVTHGFTVDQTAHMCEEWSGTPPIEYLVASSVHPHLTELLLSKDRRLTFFHNYVGVKGGAVSYAVCLSCGEMNDTGVAACKSCEGTELDAQTVGYEDWMYSALYPPTIRCGSGLNATTRAIDLALFMGFEKIYLLGADCAMVMNRPAPDAPVGSPEYLRWLREDVVMHADGGSALASNASSLTLQGVIDDGTPDRTIRPGHGRVWLTKPDMMITAVWLRDMKIGLGSRLSIIGDTLPKAILHKSDEYVEQLPSLIGLDGKPWTGKFAQ